MVALLYAAATPTEVGALGAFLSAAIGVALGRLTWGGAVEALQQTIKTSAMIFMILIGATIFGPLYGPEPDPPACGGGSHGHEPQPLGRHRRHRDRYFVVSMFMDELPLLP